MRVVLDTNVVVAGFLWRGPQYRLVERALDGAIDLVTSPALLVEIDGVLRRAKFADRLARQTFSADDLVLRYAALARVVHPAPIGPVVLADPDDDQVLACALAADADLIVSGDRHLLQLQRHQGISVVNVTDALRLTESA